MDDLKKIMLPAGLVLFGLLLYASTFIVNQYETAIKLRLGEIVGSDYEPGLHLKVPLLNNVLKFDARIQTLDSRPERFLTIEKKDVIVDSYAKWRISDAAQFFRSTGGDSARTARLLSERINTSLRNEFGKRTIQEVVSEDRLELMTALTKEIDTQATELGVDVVDVRVKKIDLPPEVSESVYNRMRAERERVARDLRAKGSEAAERIRADADRQRTVILAEAYREAEETRGKGDANAAETYANAYTADPEFYAFYRSLNAYQQSFANSESTLVLAPDTEFFKFFRSMSGKPPAAEREPDVAARPSPSASPSPAQPLTPYGLSSRAD
jgi:membrane protease subunit HflC